MMGAVTAPAALALLREGMELLEASGPAAARREAEWLLAGVLGVGRFDVYLEPARELSTDEARRYAPGFSPIVGFANVERPNFDALIATARAGVPNRPGWRTSRSRRPSTD